MRERRVLELPALSWQSAVAAFWRYPAYFLAPLLLYALAASYLNRYLPVFAASRQYWRLAENALTICVHAAIFAPLMVAIVGKILGKDGLREDWPAIWRVAVLMAGALIATAVAQRTVNLVEAAFWKAMFLGGAELLRAWYWLSEAPIAISGMLIMMLWVRLALLLPQQALRQRFSPLNAWRNMKGYYLRAVLASFLTMFLWYVAEWLLAPRLRRPDNGPFPERDPWVFDMTANHAWNLLLGSFEWLIYSALLAAISAWLYRMIVVPKYFTAPSP